MAVFGNPVIGGSAGSHFKNRLYGTSFICPGVTVASLSFRVFAAVAANFKGVIVEDTGKTIVAVGDAVAFDGLADAWVTSSFSSPPTLTGGAKYWLCYITDTDNNDVYQSTGAANRLCYDSSNSYASPTNPTDGVFTGTTVYSIYGAYTATGSANAAAACSD